MQSGSRFEFYDPLALAVAINPRLVFTHNFGASVETEDLDRLGEVRAGGSGKYIHV